MSRPCSLIINHSQLPQGVLKVLAGMMPAGMIHRSGRCYNIFMLLTARNFWLTALIPVSPITFQWEKWKIRFMVF
jgi:hypothetical protein